MPSVDEHPLTMHDVQGKQLQENISSKAGMKIGRPHGGNQPRQVALLCLLVAQNTSATILARYTRTRYKYNIDHMLLMAELMKLLTSVFLEAVELGSLGGLCRSLRENIWDNPVDALKLTIPSTLYFLQNSLVYYSISTIPVPLFQIIQQTKLVTTAVLSTLFLNRSYSRIQWLSILWLCIGSTMCILSTAKDSEDIGKGNGSGFNSIYGISLMLLSNLSSSIASIYFEVVIKGGSKSEKVRSLPSTWMRNIQMAFFTICFISMKLLLWTEMSDVPFFYDFSQLLWVQISIFAFGGLLVASVVKHTDSVRKGLATGFSVVTSSLLAMFVDSNYTISFDFIVGSMLAICGCFFFTNPDRVILLKQYKRKKICAAITSIKKARFLRISFVAALFLLVFAIQQYFGGDKNQLENSLVGLPHTTAAYSREQSITVRNDSFDDSWKEKLHIHVYNWGGTSAKDVQGCGGCMVLHELHHSLIDMNVSTSTRNGCPQEEDLVSVGNRTVVIVYPEVGDMTCNGSEKRLHVRWLLAPLSMKKNAPWRMWNDNDLVFYYASSCAMHSLFAHRRSILQVITNPKPGDEFDLPKKTLQNFGRKGTAWMTRKAASWHSNIDYIHNQLPGPHVQLGWSVQPSEWLKYEYFVSYDPYTFYTFAAAMSGVVSIVYPLANTTKQQWLEGTYVGEYLKDQPNFNDAPGIAYGVDREEIQHANQTKQQARKYLMNVRQYGKEETVERFGTYCLDHLQGRSLFGMTVKDALQ